MPLPNDDAPDYLPDGTISIHGKLARKMTISQYQKKNGETELTISTDVPSIQQIVKQVNDDIDKAYKGK
jgi:hypothetical protein